MDKPSWEDGWSDWIAFPPPYGKLIQFTRAGWDEPVIGYRENFPPEDNVANLYWKLTGIGREGK